VITCEIKLFQPLQELAILNVLKIFMSCNHPTILKYLLFHM